MLYRVFCSFLKEQTHAIMYCESSKLIQSSYDLCHLTCDPVFLRALHTSSSPFHATQDPLRTMSLLRRSKLGRPLSPAQYLFSSSYSHRHRLRHLQQMLIPLPLLLLLLLWMRLCPSWELCLCSSFLPLCHNLGRCLNQVHRQSKGWDRYPCAKRRLPAQYKDE